MAEPDKGKPVSIEELVVTGLAMTDALAKLLIEKGIITDAEFKQKCGVSAHSESDSAVNIGSQPKWDIGIIVRCSFYIRSFLFCFS